MGRSNALGFLVSSIFLLAGLLLAFTVGRYPILMSPVKYTVHGFPSPRETHREVLAPMDRAEEKAGPKDVGEQTLMRGLDTAFPFFRLGLSLV